MQPDAFKPDDFNAPTYSDGGVEMSLTIGKLSKALAAAQIELKNPGFDSKNPHFGSRYASLAVTLEGARTVLGKHGLAIMQPTCDDPAAGLYGVQTIISHESNEWIRSKTVLPLAKSGRGQIVHEIGGLYTYAKRYGLCSMLGIAGDEDLDGNVTGGDLAAPPREEPPEANDPGSGTREVAKAEIAAVTDVPGEKDADRAMCILRVTEWSRCAPEELGRSVTAVGSKMNLRKAKGFYSSKQYKKIAEYCQEAMAQGTPWEAIVPAVPE